MKYCILILTLALALCLCACGKNADPAPAPQQPVSQPAEQPQTNDPPAVDPAPSAETPPAESTAPDAPETPVYRPSVTLGDGTVLALEDIAGRYEGTSYTIEKLPDGSSKTSEKQEGEWAIVFADDGLYLLSGGDLVQLAFNEERFVYSIGGREGKVDLMADGEGGLRLHRYESDPGSDCETIVDASRTAPQDEQLLELFRQYSGK